MVRSADFTERNGQKEVTMSVCRESRRTTRANEKSVGLGEKKSREGRGTGVENTRERPKKERGKGEESRKKTNGNKSERKGMKEKMKNRRQRKARRKGENIAVFEFKQRADKVTREKCKPWAMAWSGEGRVEMAQSWDFEAGEGA